jgi:hypothetical protein
MHDAFFLFGLPTLFAMVFINLMWAWILATVKPPVTLEERDISRKVNLEWEYLENVGPGEATKGIPKEYKPPIEVAG